MNPVEDIIINKQLPPQRNGRGIVLVLIFILLILLIGSAGAYYWYKNIRETPKEAFFKYIAQTNIPKIVDVDMYYQILDKMNSSNFDTSTTANFTTSKKTDFTQNVDVSNFELVVKTISNKDADEGYIGASVTYKTNPFFDLELIKTKENIAIGSSDILSKYVATNRNSLSDSLNRTVGIQTDVTPNTIGDKMDEFADNQINLEDDYKLRKANIYLTAIAEKIPEEAITLTEDSPITINSAVVNTKAYELTLNAQAYASIVNDTLNRLKNDAEFLEKIVTGKENSEFNVEEPVQEEVDPDAPKPLTIESIEGQTVEHQTEQEVIVLDDTEEPPATEELPAEEEPTTESPADELPQDPFADPAEIDFATMFESNPGSELGSSFGTGIDTEEKEPENIFSKLMKAILFNQKLDMSMIQLQEQLENEIQKIDITDGLKVTVFVRDVEDEPKETVKILADLSATAKLDIEYPEETKAKVTFLDDVTQEDEETGEVNTKNRGTSLEIKRTDTEVQTTFNIILNTIKEQKVVEKLQIDLTTKGTETSKNYENNLIIKNTDNEGDVKVNIENTIDFQKTNHGKELNEENTIFVDQISDEEASNLFGNIVTNILSVYSDKILNMNFIDVSGNNENLDGRDIFAFGPTAEELSADSLPGMSIEDPDTNTIQNQNTTNQHLVVHEPEETPNPPDQEPPAEQEQPSTGEQEQNPPATGETAGGEPEDPAVTVETISKENIKNILAGKIENMRTEASERGEEFTVKNLGNLPEQIDGYNVSSIVTDDKATIKMAGFTFYVDKDFKITEE